MVMVAKIKNVKILVFSLVSEKVIQGQGYKCECHKGQRKNFQSIEALPSIPRTYTLEREPEGASLREPVS